MIFAGVSGIARKMKTLYIGVDSIARPVVRGWIGVDGIARLFWILLGVIRHGLISTTATRLHGAAASNSNYALFAGGVGPNTGNWDEESATVVAISPSLVISYPTPLSPSRSNLTGASTGNYALFAGGYNTAHYPYPPGPTRELTTTVDAYNTALTRYTPSEISPARSGMGGASAEGYALFAGGGLGGGLYERFHIDRYNSALTRSAVTLSQFDRYNIPATSVGYYAVFGPGLQYDTWDSNSIIAYRPTSGATTIQYLPFTVSSSAAANVGNYAIISGGYRDSFGTPTNKTNPTNICFALNSAISRRDIYMSRPMAEHVGVGVGDFAVFAGGINANQDVQVFNSALTLSIAPGMSTTGTVAGMSATSIGAYALFGSASSSLNVYTYRQ